MNATENGCAPQGEQRSHDANSSLRSLSYQIVGFKWKKANGNSCSGVEQGSHDTWQPFIVLSNGSDAEEPARLGLWGGKFNIKLGAKSCAGYFSCGRHFKCPDSADVGLASTCQACKQRDDWFGCIQCTGIEETNSSLPSEARRDTRIAGDKISQQNIAPVILCNNPKQRDGCMKNNYWLYLAAFDGHVKVGISYERRFFERMIEQGADFGCRLAIVQDGGYARALEQRVVRYLGLPDKMHGSEKQAMLFGEPNRSIAGIASALARLLDGGPVEARPEIFDFRQYYRLGSVPVRPRPVQLVPGIRLFGDVIATKGNIIVMRTAAGVISFDARRLVGYQVELRSTGTSET